MDKAGILSFNGFSRSPLIRLHTMKTQIAVDRSHGLIIHHSKNPRMPIFGSIQSQNDKLRLRVTVNA